MPRLCFLPLLLSFALSNLASTPIATVTSVRPFAIDGHFIISPGVTSFPLVPGDTIATSKGPAVLLFPDGSVVKLAVSSTVEIEPFGSSLKLILLAGALDYKLVPGALLVVVNLDTERHGPGAAKITEDDAKRVNPPGNAKPTWANPAFLLPSGGGGGMPLMTKHL